MNVFKQALAFLVMFSATVSVDAQAFMDVLQRFAPYYYQNFSIQSSQITKNEPRAKSYKFIATNGLEIDVSLSMCWGCAGTGRNPMSVFGGCPSCGGTGWAPFVTGYQPANGAVFDAQGNPSAGGGSYGSSGNSRGNSTATTGKQWKNCHSCGGGGGCKYCSGTGVDPYTRTGNCGVCHGSGVCTACRGEKGYWY